MNSQATFFIVATMVAMTFAVAVPGAPTANSSPVLLTAPSPSQQGPPNQGPPGPGPVGGPGGAPEPGKVNSDDQDAAETFGFLGGWGWGGWGGWGGYYRYPYYGGYYGGYRSRCYYNPYLCGGWYY